MLGACVGLGVLGETCWRRVCGRALAVLLDERNLRSRPLELNLASQLVEEGREEMEQRALVGERVRLRATKAVKLRAPALRSERGEHPLERALVLLELLGRNNWGL